MFDVPKIRGLEVEERNRELCKSRYMESKDIFCVKNTAGLDVYLMTCD